VSTISFHEPVAGIMASVKYTQFLMCEVILDSLEEMIQMSVLGQW